MKNKLTKKLLSALLALAMLLSLVPAASLTASAVSVAEEWTTDITVTETRTINGNVLVNSDITLTIAEGVTLTVNGRVIASGMTLTADGGGTLVVNGVNGPNGTDHNPVGGVYNGTAGYSGGPGISGNIYVAGASVVVNGGNGGNGGSSETDGAAGGNGGNAIDGAVTLESGSITATGGKGGSGGVILMGGSGANGSDGKAVTGSITVTGTGATVQESDNNIEWIYVSGGSSDKRFIHGEVAAPTETPLTTITATGDRQASYSTANVANVSFSTTAGGALSYLANWGWWGYGWSVTVNAAEGYTITKCVFYDDANRNATDSEAPFVVETTEEDKTPRINGTPIDGGNDQSKGLKKIEVYGYSNASAATAYVAYLPAETDDETALAAKVVKFNGMDWYLIEDNSTSATAGTVTLFAKDTIGSSRFDNSNNVYSGSMVKSYLDNLTAEGGAFADVADAIVSTDLEDVTVTGAKLWLLSKDEVTTTYKLSTALNKCSNDWWLRTPVTSSYLIYVNGESGSVVNSGNFHMNTYGVRPALNLDLSKVEFDSESNEFVLAGTYQVDFENPFTSDYYSDDKAWDIWAKSDEYEVYLAISSESSEFPVGTYTKDNGIIMLYTGLYRVSDDSFISIIDAEATITKDDEGINIKAKLKSDSGDTYIINISRKHTIVELKFAEDFFAGYYSSFKDWIITAETDVYYVYLDLLLDNPVLVDGTYSSEDGKLDMEYSYFRKDGVNQEIDVITITVTSDDNRIYIAATFENLQDDVEYKVEMSKSRHNFIYSAQGDTITAVCQDEYCELEDHKATLTLVAPTLKTYGQTGEGVSAEATITDENNIRGDAAVSYYKATKNEDDDTYTKSGDALAAAPTDAGDYIAEITLGTGEGAATASVVYAIAKADPTANAPAGATATYGQTLADVTLTNPSGNTAGTWAWVDDTQSVGNVISPAATFKANFTPTDTNNYNVAENIDVTVTVGKADPTYTVPAGLTVAVNSLLSAVALPDGWSWKDGTQNVGDVGDKTFKAVFTPEDTANYNVVSDIDVAVGVRNVPEYDIPDGLTAGYGETLADVLLPDGWSWDDSTEIVGDLGENVHKATFTPEDTANYLVVSGVDLTVTVGKGTIKNYTKPTAAHIKYPQTLSEATLTGGDTGDIEGVWSWVVPDAQPTSEQSGSSFELIFTPTGDYAELYNPIVTRLAVIVEPAEFEPDSISDADEDITLYGEFAKDVRLELTPITHNQSAYLALLRASSRDASGLRKLVLFKTMTLTGAEEAYNGTLTLTSFVGEKRAGETVSAWFFIDGAPVNYVGTVDADGFLVIEGLTL